MRFIEWLDDRLQIKSMLKDLFDHPVPKRKLSFLDFLGFATAFSFFNQAFTGLLLATVYKPSAKEAYASIQGIQNNPLEHFIRSLHFWGANFMVVLIFLHILRVFFVSAYKKPRELTWLVGGVLLIGTLGLAFTGYLLPWDQQAYWATTVGTAIAGYMPVIGHYLVSLARDGSNVTGLTLTRFYAVHMLLLPALILAAFGVHFFLVLRQGMSFTEEVAEAKREGGQVRGGTEPFWPNTVWKMMLFVSLIGVALWVLALRFPAGLGHAADPLNKSQYIPEPVRYFFSIYQLLKYFPGKLDVIGTVGLPLVFIVVLFGLPFFDRNLSRKVKKRPFALGTAGIVVVAIIALTYIGYQSVPKAVASTGVKAHPSFSGDILPVLQSSCASCHGSSGGLTVTSYDGIMHTGDDKPVVIPGHPASSLLVQKLLGTVQPQMPLGQNPLSRDQIQNIENWIKDGAKNN